MGRETHFPGIPTFPFPTFEVGQTSTDSRRVSRDSPAAGRRPAGKQRIHVYKNCSNKQTSAQEVL